MRAGISDWIETVCRVGLGGLFVYSAWSKIEDPGLFADMVVRYDMLPMATVGIFALTLPMLELLTGLMLVFTKWLREAALLVTALLAMFLTALTVAVVRGLEIDCGCFGVSAGGGRRELLLAIGRDVALLAPAVWLLFRRNAWIGKRGIALLLAAAVLGGGIWMLRDKQKEEVKHQPAPASTQPPKSPVGTKGGAAKAKSGHRRGMAPERQPRAKPELEADEDDLSPVERQLKEAIEEALDKEDFAMARGLSAKAAAAESTEVRQAMVDTLGWFGVKALPELTPFLADPDEDVRDSAMNEWSMAVSEIEDDAEKLGVVELAMHVLSDEDALEDISGEYIGVDEKLAVESLLRIIEAEGSAKGVEKAKETYEFVTGDEFVDRATAEKWLAEEYEPDGE